MSIFFVLKLIDGSLFGLMGFEKALESNILPNLPQIPIKKPSINSLYHIQLLQNQLLCLSMRRSAVENVGEDHGEGAESCNFLQVTAQDCLIQDIRYESLLVEDVDYHLRYRRLLLSVQQTLQIYWLIKNLLN